MSKKNFFFCCAVKNVFCEIVQKRLSRKLRKSHGIQSCGHIQNDAHRKLFKLKRSGEIFFIALFCKINWFMMVNDFDKIVLNIFWAHFYSPHSLWFPSFVETLIVKIYVVYLWILELVNSFVKLKLLLIECVGVYDGSKWLNGFKSYLIC